jgi:Ca-activated chloride channel family protein
MSFLHPEFLYYMMIPLFILFALLLTQKEAQTHFFSQEVMNKLRVSANTLTLKARNALFMLIGFLMIIALAQPVINDGTVEVKAKSADIMIALDISDSMLAEDVYPNRIKLAKQKAIELLKMQPDERIGVIGFAKNSYLVSPLSFDHGAVSFLLSQLNTDSITEKGTDFLTMLDVVDQSLDKKSKRYLLILSDGGDKSDFSAEIESAKEKNITVFILGIGTLKGAPIKLEDGSFITQNSKIIVSKLNENISDLATKSGGVYIQNSKSDDDIKAMLKEILRVGVQKELKSEEVKRYIPLFYYPLGLALLLLLIATSSIGKKETKTLASAFVLFTLFFVNTNAEAGLLDFVDLHKAKEAYENKEYEKAAKLYEKHAKSSNNAQSYYNEGNSFYKQKQYDKAIESYEKASFDNNISNADNLANIGNAYAKQGSQEKLQKAVESYEKSLKIKEDKDTRENLEIVKKLLKKNEDKNKKDKNDKDKKSKDSKDSKKEDKSDENKKSSKDTKDSKEDKNKDSKKENKSKKDEKKSDDKEKSSKDLKKDNNETKKEQKQDLKQLSKDDNKTSNSSSDAQLSKDKMSDSEEKKWLQKLNMQKSTYMYQLNNEKIKKEDADEKPW